MDLRRIAGKVGEMNGPVQAMDVEVGDVVTAASNVRTTTSRSDDASDWLCAWCLNRVASDDDRYVYGGESEFAFKNPNGVLFQIITFAQTIGCRQVGVPTFDYTWFAGHAWSYCECDRCRAHLGWFYSGPGEFVGLIKDRIVRATLALN